MISCPIDPPILRPDGIAGQGVVDGLTIAHDDARLDIRQGLVVLDEIEKRRIILSHDVPEAPACQLADPRPMIFSAFSFTMEIR